MIFAHVRATTEGNLAEQNCHPFKNNSLMFMHNGNIGAFQSVKRALAASVEERWFLGVQGSTDSEWAFALFLDSLEKLGHDPDKDPGPSGFGGAVLREALLQTIMRINAFTAEQAKKSGTTEAISLLNLAVTMDTASCALDMSTARPMSLRVSFFRPETAGEQDRQRSGASTKWTAREKH